mmetsp:Transcript_26538/g.68063  ORF Transcript_26538/g.68063 Transcript_26538/m.68063 type:complete len:144 (-) Transcript_26538:2070-2501(-)
MLSSSPVKGSTESVSLLLPLLSLASPPSIVPVWAFTSALYLPSSFAMSSSCDPTSTMTPSSTTHTASACRIVERRCAITMVVLPSIMVSSAPCTRRSLSLSSALVASSKSMILGSQIMARAMARRCFCPPDSCTPRSPTEVRS